MTAEIGPVRRAGVPAAESFADFDASHRPPLNTTMITVKIGDVIDVGILWGAWCKANGARLKTSAWAAAGAPVSSPQAPTISAQLMDDLKGETVAVLDTSGAAVGDTYYLENTVVVERDSGLTGIVYPDRTVKRRIQVKVAAG